jgi:hypothetical protein
LKLTAAQMWLIHTLETLFFGAVVVGGTTAYQDISKGNYSVSALAGIVIPAVIAVLSKGSSSVMSNALTGQAAGDTLGEIRGMLSGLLTGHNAVLNALHVILAQQTPPLPATAASPMMSAASAAGAGAQSLPVLSNVSQQAAFPDRPTYPFSAAGMPMPAAPTQQVRH